MEYNELPQNVKDIVEKTFGITPKYAIIQIREDEGLYTIWFNNQGCISLDYRTMRQWAEIFEKHYIHIQFPGNTDYLWSLSLIGEP